jgi:hypothetical protein
MTRIGHRRSIASADLVREGRVIDVPGEAAVAELDKASIPPIRQPQLEADLRISSRPSNASDAA